MINSVTVCSTYRVDKEVEITVRISEEFKRCKTLVADGFCTFTTSEPIS